MNFSLIQALQRRGFYYGWVVLFAGTVGIVMSVPGQTIGVSVFTDFLIEDLGLSRTQLSLSYMLGTISSAFLLPLAGKALDRFGARRLGVVASIFLSFFLFFLATSPSLLSHLQEAQSLAPPFVLSFLLSYFAFLGIRHFGQGQLAMISRSMMALWFEKRRGLMLGVSGLFVSFGFGVAPLFLNDLIQSLGWQQALERMAIASLAMALFAYVFFRRSPEHCGLRIDGGMARNLELGDEDPLPADDSFTASQAKRTYTFWVFNFGLVNQAMLVTAATFHISSIARFSGVDNDTAFRVFLPLSVVAVVADFIAGFLSDRIPLKYLLAAKQLGIVLALLGLQNFDQAWGFGLTAFGFGVSSGVFALLNGAAWPKLFGRAHLGAIAGVSMGWIVFGSAVGPYLFSIGQEGEGNYRLIMGLSMLFPLAVFLASFRANNPRS